jgi:5-methylcytosine-specific restriction protein A
MKTFEAGALYTRKEVHQLIHPGESYPGASWSTGYLKVGSSLIAFANISTPGKDGRDYPNSYDSVTGQMTWFGKSNAHSAQPTFKHLFDGDLAIQMFVRWDNKNTTFTYLGSPKIDQYEDSISIGPSIETIKLSLRFDGDGDDQLNLSEVSSLIRLEGGRQTITVNRFERDPRLRIECLNYHGSICRVCSFDFKATYGPIGRDYCHIHHTKPLASLDGSTMVNPITDLIPLCPNCHAMIHRRNPAISIEELKSMLKLQGVINE